MCREVLAPSPSFPRWQHLLKLAHYQSQVPGSLRSHRYARTRVHRHVWGGHVTTAPIVKTFLSPQDFW